MQTITTYNGTKLILVEVPKDNESITLGKQRNTWFLQIKNKHNIPTKYSVVNVPKSVKIIGTTSTLTNVQVEPFVEKDGYLVIEFNVPTTSETVYKNYKTNKFTFDEAKGSWITFLQANNIDLSKEYIILKLLNNE